MPLKSENYLMLNVLPVLVMIQLLSLIVSVLKAIESILEKRNLKVFEY
jgi:hypothetical protein